jgi:phosphatidylinositol N-acetylglucosaminyltransferase subunit A
LLLTEPEPAALLAALSEVIPFARKRPLPNYHAEVSQMYSWLQVARRTVKVYDQVSQRPRPSLADRFRDLRELGALSGPLAILFVAVQHLCLALLCYLRPAANIDVCPDFVFDEWASRRIKIEPLPMSERYLSSLSKRRHFVMNGTG